MPTILSILDASRHEYISADDVLAGDLIHHRGRWVEIEEIEYEEYEDDDYTRVRFHLVSGLDHVFERTMKVRVRQR